MIKDIVKLLVILPLLAGCSTFSGIDDRFSGNEENFAAGSAVSAALTNPERVELRQAFVNAMDTGESQRWSSKRANGAIKPGQYLLSNLKSHPDTRIPVSRGDLDLSSVMETDLGLYVLIRNSNVRIGPGTDNQIAEVLPAGAGVEVIGETSAEPWMLIASDGVVRGYIYRNLLIKAPGTELELAGGPERRAFLCREFKQKLVSRAGQDEWDGAACQRNGKWQLAPPEPARLTPSDDPFDNELDGF